ncbi:MAG: MotA/TolQ/ExbB proton channel family protein [Candidatus Adiutrix sp.]|nr:MotA/TolQ/ExbB proton channel family protein [Candidatus Adiutrix sp.]
MSLTLIAQAQLPPPRTGSAPAPADIGPEAASSAQSAPSDPATAPSAPTASAEPAAAPTSPAGPDGGPETPAGTDSGQITSPETGPATPEAMAPPPESLSSSVGLPSAPPQDMSVKHMFLNADPVVQGVMVLLLLASVATWVVIFEKTFVLRRASRQIMLFKRAAARPDQKIAVGDFSELSRPIVKAGLKESRDGAGSETRNDYRERVERSMRAELAGLMDHLGYRTLFLASVGSVSPFVGLFGTVWGIMHSFIGIASSGETTLAVVAPGIAEALFATAMGLVAAIPAVIAYNKITGTLKKMTKEALNGIGLMGNHLARLHFSGGETWNGN